MLRIIVICFTAAVAWGLWWGLSAWHMHSATDQWLKDRQAEGWQAEYTDMRLRGFPNRLDRTFTGLALANPRAGWAWTVPTLGMYQLIYKPEHQILAVEGPMHLRTGGTDWQIDSQGLRASVVLADDDIQRADAEATTLNLGDGTRALAMADIKAALRHTGPRDYQLALTVGRLVTGAHTRAGADLALNMTVTLDDVLRPDASATRLRPQVIDLTLAKYTLDGLTVEATGTLDVDSFGRLSGRLNLRAVNWRDLLRAAIDAGQIQRDVGQALERGLGLLAGLQGNPTTLDIPLDIAGDALRIGPIRVGTAPRLWTKP